MSLDNLLLKIGDLAQRRDKALETDLAIKDEDKELRENIKKSVLAGESTGDIFEDYGIVHYGSSVGQVNRVRKLIEKISENTGEQFLLIDHHPERHMFRGCFGGEGPKPSDYHFDIQYTFGFLDKHEFNLEKGTVELLSNNIVCNDHFRSSRGAQIGSLSESVNLPYWIVNKVDSDISAKDASQKEHNLHIHTDEDIKHHYFFLVGEKVEEYFKLKKDEDTYDKLLLRLADHSPEKYKERALRAGTQERINVIKDIVKSTFNKAELKRQEKSKLKENLVYAVALNIHKDEFEYDASTPGIKINIPEYVSNLCEKYEVKILK